MNRKLKKLLRSPLRFFADAFRKRAISFRRRWLPRLAFRTVSPRRYSVVCAVYGVEKYLDDFFESMVSQSLDFDRHIELIMVDDGSLDGSAAIIEKWRARHPQSIRYIKKENGGAASARNAGIEYATGDWITFCDPDDFVDYRYFESVDTLIAANPTVGFVGANLIYYFEKSGLTRNTHPLRYKFAKGDKVLRLGELESDIHLSGATAFFDLRSLRQRDLRFDERIRPVFEDAHLVGRFLLEATTGLVGFCANAKYYYRKRQSADSLLDTSWTKPERYFSPLEFGSKDLLDRAEAIHGVGNAPRWVQRVVLYDAVWHFKYLVNQSVRVGFLDEVTRATYDRLLALVLTRIDTSVILEFELAGCSVFLKTGILARYKGEAPWHYNAYVEEYDTVKHLARVRYFCRKEGCLEEVRLNGRDVAPVFAKTRFHEFLGEHFVSERILWVEMPAADDVLTVRLDSKQARIFVHDEVHQDEISCAELRRVLGSRQRSARSLPLATRAIHMLARLPFISSRYRGAWLFMDRDIQADDSAEHLYRHVHGARPEINAFFLLRRESHDWARLNREGFRLIEFDSREHELALKGAKHVISSHADRYVVGKLSDWRFRGECSARFTFLQHGVIKDDLSSWLNSKTIDRFVTSSHREFDSIVSDGTLYKYSFREVCLTGLPRHDALWRRRGHAEQMIAIMPTWRESLLGHSTGLTNNREPSEVFFESEYAKRWKSVLHSPLLRKMSSDFCYRVVFFPHANMKPYFDWFETPRHIELGTHASGSIQDVFAAAKILVTDFSSVAFEAAYIGRAVVYYQFDRELVFGGGHLTRPGYFDYERDGFGPVVEEEVELIRVLREILERGGQPEQKYLERMDRTFAFRDEKNCERVLNAIVELDDSSFPREEQRRLLIDGARKASAVGAWALAADRWRRVLELPPEAIPSDAAVMLEAALSAPGFTDGQFVGNTRSGPT
jgi:glycosyltransferase involved in cell wall biosynthesis